MAFNFRLETLLRIRKRMEEAAEMEFASLALKRDRAEKALHREQSRLEEARRDMEKHMERGILSDEFQLKWLQISHLEQRCKELASELEKAELDLMEGRSELTRRHTDRELVENLKERDLKRYLQEVDRQLQKELDDLASLRHNRSKNRPA